MIEEELQSLGLTKGETKAYLAMLELGPSTVGPIAKKSGISYSKIYEVLQRLIDKGIVSFIVRENVKTFQAINPDMLHEYLDRQEQEIEKSRDKLKDLVPELKRFIGSSEENQEAEIFVGIRGLRSANEKLFANVDQKNQALFLYVPNKEHSSKIDEFYLNIAPFYKKKKIKFKGIGSKEWTKSNYIKKTSSFIEARYVDFPLPGTIDIYQDMILEVSWGREPVGILIKSKEISDNYRRYFEELWKIAKK